MGINLALSLVILHPFLMAFRKNLFTLWFREFQPFLAGNEALVIASDLLNINERAGTRQAESKDIRVLDWLYNPCGIWRFQSLSSLFKESRGDDWLDEKTWFYHCLLCFKGFPILEKVIFIFDVFSLYWRDQVFMYRIYPCTNCTFKPVYFTITCVQIYTY
jgi:hypothetical protein